MENIEIKNLIEEFQKEADIFIEELSNYKKNILKCPEVTLPILGGFFIPSIISNDHLGYQIMATTALCSFALSNSFRIHRQNYELFFNEPFVSFHEKIRLQKSFQVFYKEYQQLLSSYSKFLTDIKITSPTDISVFYRNCLKDGYLSVTRDNIFENLTEGYEALLPPEIIGARITTGSSVCKNNASFLVDVMRKKEITSSNLLVAIKKSRIPSLLALINSNYKDSYNHQIVGYIENDELVIYDPTNNFIFDLSKLILKKDGVEIGKAIGIPVDVSIVLSSHEIYVLEKEKREELNLYPRAHISEEEWMDRRDAIKEKYLASEDDLEDFWHEQEERIRYLSEGYEKLRRPKREKVKQII